MLKIREAVIVEGRYDKIKLSSIVDAPKSKPTVSVFFPTKKSSRLSAKLPKQGEYL